MAYYTGSLAAVPSANRQKYIDYIKGLWPIFQKYGAIRMVENWGVDIPKGKVNDFYTAVDAKDGEAITLSWIEWPDKVSADAAWEKMPLDPDLQNLSEMPFDGKRMVFGGFAPVVDEGKDSEAGYIQGFVLAVPQENKQAYIAVAHEAWEAMFKPNGCLGTIEGWGIDVPHGKQTDFYRATKAKQDEVPVFSWAAWPDKATCDAAGKAMEAEMQGKEFPQMPFDGTRMIWGGFEIISDSARS